MTPSLRIATSADIGAILELFNGGRPPGSPALSVTPDNPKVRAAFASIDADPNHELYVAELDGAVVGVFQLMVLPTLTRGGLLRAELESLHVRADLRGRGIGGRMVAFAAERARARGCGQVQLTSNKARTDAHRFYERAGFARSHEGFKLAL